MKRLKPTTANRILYGTLLVGVAMLAWTTGERLAYLSLLVLSVMPVASLVFTFVALRGIRVGQGIPHTVIKNEDCALKLRLNNPTPIPFVNVECVLRYNKYTTEVEEMDRFTLQPFTPETQMIPFTMRYRGRYQIGVDTVQATDFMGLFHLRRNYKRYVDILALPRVVEVESTPLAMNLMTDAASRFDIRDEDYATISDIRPYVPTDSVKRVHWKLTAKRNEWMVKLFQSNALNTVTIIMDSARRNISEGERYSLEDQIVENTIGLLRFCLTKNMPVELRVTNGAKAHAGNLADFDTAYHMLAELEFEDKTLLNPLAVLTQLLTDAGGNVNIVIFTANITIRLYTQLANAVSKGHYAAVVYFATEKPSPECERIFRLMDEGGFPVFRMRSWGEEE